MLFRRAWVPERPHRALLLVHGYAEHSGRYEELATWLAGRGAAVHAYDHRGHGLSEGRRTHARHMDEFTTDLAQMLELVRQEQPGLPVTLVGHSMGGLITLSFLVREKPVVHGAVLSGPAIGLDGVSPMRIRLAKLLRATLPVVKLGAGLDPAGLSRDPEVVRRYLEDPLVFREMTAGLGATMVEAAADVALRGADVDVPLLVLHGEADPICAADASRRLAADVTSTGSANRSTSPTTPPAFQSQLERTKT